MDGFQIAMLALVAVCGAFALWCMLPVLTFVGAMFYAILV